jgi:hypothetical protein
VPPQRKEGKRLGRVTDGKDMWLGIQIYVMASNLEKQR